MIRILVMAVMLFSVGCGVEQAEQASDRQSELKQISAMDAAVAATQAEWAKLGLGETGDGVETSGASDGCTMTTCCYHEDSGCLRVTCCCDLDPEYPTCQCIYTRNPLCDWAPPSPL